MGTCECDPHDPRNIEIGTRCSTGAAPRGPVSSAEEALVQAVLGVLDRLLDGITVIIHLPEIRHAEIKASALKNRLRPLFVIHFLHAL